MAILALLSLMVQTAVAWRPSEWVFVDWPWAYEPATGDWHWFDTNGVQWVHGYPPGNGWEYFNESPLASGWSFYAWPFSYGQDIDAWHYLNESDALACVNMRTEQWSVFGSVDPVLDAHEAWRGTEEAHIANSNKYTPGLLVTANIDGTSPDPREAKLVFKALPVSSGFTRHIRCSPAGKLEFRRQNESEAAWIPLAAEVPIPGDIDTDFVRDVAMHQPSTWTAHTSVTVEYVVRDSGGREVASDRIRLLRPVVMAAGDSMTFGFMRSSAGTRLTPPLAGSSGWQRETGWIAYPDDAEWAALSSPWNVPAHKADPTYQGFRGFLSAALPGFLWAGDNPLGHGPCHMGYNGAKIDEIPLRATLPGTLTNGPCYAIVIYFAGLNDVVNGRSALTMYGDWTGGVQALLNARRNRGKTLLIGATLPRLNSRYSMYSADKQNQLIALNSAIRNHPLSAAHVRYAVADAENVPHDSVGGLLDDGLHYFHVGYGSIGDILGAAIRSGLL